jgi:uncharacterized protein with GYD domain
MATFFMFGRYSRDSVREISAERTEQALNIIEHAGGKIHSMYAILGRYDLVIIADFPDTREAMKASVGLNMVTGISFDTTPAIPTDEFDKMVSEI